jgi:hypothetical protein
MLYMLCFSVYAAKFLHVSFVEILRASPGGTTSAVIVAAAVIILVVVVVALVEEHSRSGEIHRWKYS